MNNLFIPYQQALDLKELRFDEGCLAKYAIYNPKDPIALFPQSQDFFKGYFNYCKNSDYTDKIAAPTFSQAFKFFRDKGYGLIDKPFFSSKDTPNITYAKDIIHWSSGKVYKGARFNSYEESELECLKKLIELEKK